MNPSLDQSNSVKRGGATGKTVKISAALFTLAEDEAERAQRSTPKQIEFWSLLGRAVERGLRTEDCHALITEQKLVNDQSLVDAFPSAETIMAELEEDRANGVMSSSVTSSSVIYEMDKESKGRIRRISADGSKALGTLVDGEFVESE